MSVDSSERRGETRIPIEGGVLPFLGSRENGASSFTYFLRDVSEHGVGVLVPEQRAPFPGVGDAVNFHLPFQLNRKFYNQGSIRWQKRTDDGMFCGALLDGRVPLKYPIYVAFDTANIRFELSGGGFSNAGEMVRKVIEDAFYFKKGVQIYFNHLRPFLARRSFADGNRLELSEIGEAIERNVRALERSLEQATAAGADAGWLGGPVMGDLRTAVALELDIDRLGQVFDERVSWPYLRSIKLLEHQLYSNFNTLVLLRQKLTNG